MKTCKRLFQFLFIAVATIAVGQSALTVPAPQFPDANHTRYFIQTTVQNPYQLTQLSQWLRRNNFDVAGMDWRNGRVEVITNEQGIQFLESKGLTGYAVIPANTLGMESGPDPKYLNPQSTVQKLQGYAQAYPNLTRLVEIGKSLQGRPIMALLISETPNSNDPKNLDKPSIIFDAEHHAREVMTPEIVMDVADTMLKSFRTSATVKSILDTWNIWLVPMVNPDGSNIVFTTDNMWRKNARGNATSVYGVDINRNYTYRWANCNGSSTSTSADDYHGTAAGSEPETQALMKFAESVQPTASLSYHSYSEFVLYSYGCHGSLPSEKAMVEKIGSELAQRLPSDSGKGNYTPGTPWQLLYDVDGDSMDWMYATFGALSYTFEINQDFQPPYSQRDPTVAKHRNAWGYFLTRINQNLLSVEVVDGKSKNPSPALIAIDTVPRNQGELPFRTNEGGRYFKVLDPGHYVISAKLQDGRVGQTAVDMNGQPQKLVLTVN